MSTPAFPSIKYRRVFHSQVIRELQLRGLDIDHLSPAQTEHAYRLADEHRKPRNIAMQLHHALYNITPTIEGELCA